MLTSMPQPTPMVFVSLSRCFYCGSRSYVVSFC